MSRQVFSFLKNDFITTHQAKNEVFMHIWIWSVIGFYLLVQYLIVKPIEIIPKHYDDAFTNIKSSMDTQVCTIPDWDSLSEILKNDRTELLKTKSVPWCLPASSTGRQVENLSKLKELVGHLKQTIKEHQFRCLAAIHVGSPIKVFVMNDEPFINARLVKVSEDDTFLSLEESPLQPNVLLRIKRYKKITIEYTDSYRLQVKADYEGDDALCIQHVIQSFERPI